MLTGKLVTLRAIEPDDYPALNRWSNDVEVEVLSGGAPPSPHPLADTTALHERLAADQDAVNFAIEAEGTMIGTCGLFRFDHIARVAELGITIGEHAYWGRGYGRDAVELLVEYGFRHRSLHKVVLTVNGSNERAIRAYQAVGFVEEGRQRAQVWSDGRYDDLVLMGRIRPLSGADSS
jgi:RimJ/RimL family protein N-acetyltransferase